MVRHESDPEVIHNERRHGPRRALPGRRAEDEAAELGSDDLRALIAQLSKQVDRERDDRLREREETLERVKAVEERYASVNIRLIRWGAVVGLLLALAAWFGPTRLSTLLKALFGAP